MFAVKAKIKFSGEHSHGVENWTLYEDIKVKLNFTRGGKWDVLQLSACRTSVKVKGSTNENGPLIRQPALSTQRVLNITSESKY